MQRVERQHAVSPLISLLPQNKRQVLLDIGCGAGEQTALLAAQAGRVVGIDRSAQMIARARSHFSDIEFHKMDASAMTWENAFDVVFSDGAFHWICDQAPLLQRIHRALTPEGMLLCEFGAVGNIATIEHAIESVLGSYGYRYESHFFFPSAEYYGTLLKKHGFQVDALQEFEFPFPLDGGKTGLRNLLRHLFASELAPFRQQVQEEMFVQVENIFCANLWDGSRWIADCRRLRVAAHKVQF